MLKTVQVITFEERTVCDACHAKDGGETEACDVLSLGDRSWDLCAAHAERFGEWLADAMDASEADAESVPEPVEPVEVEAESQSSVLISGEIDGYDWDDAREAVRNLGYGVVGRADERTVLIICGKGAERNNSKLRDARERGLPCMDATVPGAFKAAVRAGVLKGGDPLPEPARQDAPAVLSEREQNQLIRAWARANGYTVPDRGRIPMQIRHAYELTHRDAPEGEAEAA
ncbi:Lsr2 family DNA-binding protein [Streptomyces sp. P1-3]|uniref:Lsr2 family DNA-binding protein n=1 Tax=Streptomyces sp. P1-3 TaxID=3421658 RepID=UPI003D36E401